MGAVRIRKPSGKRVVKSKGQLSRGVTGNLKRSHSKRVRNSGMLSFDNSARQVISAVYDEYKITHKTLLAYIESI